MASSRIEEDVAGEEAAKMQYQLEAIIVWRQRHPSRRNESSAMAAKMQCESCRGVKKK